MLEDGIFITPGGQKYQIKSYRSSPSLIYVLRNVVFRYCTSRGCMDLGRQLGTKKGALRSSSNQASSPDRNHDDLLETLGLVSVSSHGRLLSLFKDPLQRILKHVEDS